ncbi:MAG: type II secretion system F family protein [Elusimicrobia bacterium]|nr:type II secretion system F family protein [Elusimicrobiota bacterium]
MGSMDLNIGLGIRRINFYRLLADSARSGLSPLRALEMLAADRPFPSAATLEGLRRQVQGGFTFSRAMRTYPDDFPSWQTEIVGVGETTGRLDTAFGSVADALEEQRSFILSMLPGLLYPLFLLHLAPFLLNAPVAINQGLAPYLLLVFRFLLWFYIPAGALVLACSQGFVPLRSLPLLSALSKMRFNHFLSAMLKAGVPFLKALEVAARAADVPAKGPRPASGAGVLEHLRNYDIFSPDDLSYIGSAELSGRLGETLDRLAEQARQKWQAILKSISTILPPVFYLAIALGLAYRIFNTLHGYAIPSGF